MNESVEEIMKKYKLSDEEHEKMQKVINNIYLYNKVPVENPFAIINIAPPGSGKTGLNSYSKSQFPDNNVIIINSDEIKPFHPNVDEIAKKHPGLFTKITDQESNTWTSSLFDYVLKNKYNVIFEGTGKNTRILDTIKEKMKDYKVIVRGMAVNEINCLTSILERYKEQVETLGWGRLVVLPHFDETYREMPNTLETIEKSGIVNAIEVYGRSENPSKPKLLYRGTNTQGGSKNAILNGRRKDEEKSLHNFRKFNSTFNMEGCSDEEQTIIDRLIIRYNELDNNVERY